MSLEIGFWNVCATSLALKSDTTTLCARSTPPSVSQSPITIRPRSWFGPVLYNRTLALTSEAVRRRKSFELLRIASASRKLTTASRMFDGAGRSAGFASSGRMIGQFDALSPAGGSPTPQLLAW